jgi:hypothetical protein
VEKTMKRTNLWQIVLLIATVSVLTASAVAPAAAEQEFMAFYNANTGATVSGVLADDGTYQDRHSIPNIYRGWTHVVATTNDRILFYNGNAGWGAVGSLYADGIYSQTQNLTPFSQGWTHIVPFGYGKLFFYNANTGRGVVGIVEVSFSGVETAPYRDLRVIPGFATGWTSIVAVSNNMLLFYNANTGQGATGYISDDGNFHMLQSLIGFAKGWTHITRLDPGRVLFYNANTAASVTGVVSSEGVYSDVKNITGSIGPGWTHIVRSPTSNGLLFFYSFYTGLGASGKVLPDGSFVTVRVLPGFSTGWTSIASLRG